MKLVSGVMWIICHYLLLWHLNHTYLFIFILLIVISYLNIASLLQIIDVCYYIELIPIGTLLFLLYVWIIIIIFIIIINFIGPVLLNVSS